MVKLDLHPKIGETLCAYYLRTHFHLIPDEVEFYEVDESTRQFTKLPFNPVHRDKNQA